MGTLLKELLLKLVEQKLLQLVLLGLVLVIAFGLQFLQLCEQVFGIGKIDDIIFVSVLISGDLLVRRISPIAIDSEFVLISLRLKQF